MSWHKDRTTMYKTKQMIRFVVVGSTTALIYALLLSFFVYILDLNPTFSAGTAYLVCITYNYFAHYFWTYQTDEAHHKTSPRFFVLCGCILLVNMLVTEYIPKYFGIRFEYVQIALFISIPALTFFVQLFWVFKRRESRSQMF